MTLLLRTVLFLAASSSLSSAASIAYAAAADIDVRDWNLNPLGSSYTARVGFLAPGTILTTASSFDQINGSFQSVGQVNFASGGVAGFNGYFSGNATFADSAGLAGQDVYLWFTNGSNENAVLRSNTVDFLADSAIPNANSVDVAAEFMSSFTILLGTHIPHGPNAANGGSIILGIPEPSAALLGVLGSIGLLRRRR